MVFHTKNSPPIRVTFRTLNTALDRCLKDRIRRDPLLTMLTRNTTVRGDYAHLEHWTTVKAVPLQFDSRQPGVLSTTRVNDLDYLTALLRRIAAQFARQLRHSARLEVMRWGYPPETPAVFESKLTDVFLSCADEGFAVGVCSPEMKRHLPYEYYATMQIMPSRGWPRNAFLLLRPDALWIRQVHKDWLLTLEADHDMIADQCLIGVDAHYRVIVLHEQTKWIEVAGEKNG